MGEAFLEILELAHGWEQWEGHTDPPILPLLLLRQFHFPPKHDGLYQTRQYTK